MTDRDDELGKIVPLFGRDEMNMIEFPYGPISSTKGKTLEVDHVAWDPKLKRYVTQSIIVAGSEKWGLPRPIDDRVFLGLKQLTFESNYMCQTIEFTRYQLCRAIRWEPDGRSYRRLEESFDRFKSTTLKFKDAWYDNAEKQYKSRSFSVIDDYQLCSRDQLDRARLAGDDAPHQRSFFKWSDVMWKSFKDGYIKKVDNTMYFRIAEGRKREVPLRLYRILDKRFYKKTIARFRLKRLCVGTLGLSRNYGPAQMLRLLERSVKWLIKCEYLEDWWCTGPQDNPVVHFRRRRVETQQLIREQNAARISQSESDRIVVSVDEVDSLKQWLACQHDEELDQWEAEALETGFGSEFERSVVVEERSKGISIRRTRRIRQEFVRRFVGSESMPNQKILLGP